MGKQVQVKVKVQVPTRSINMAKALALWALSILALQALCFSANAAAGEKVTVAMLVHQKVEYGQLVKVVGNADELYNWNYTAAPGLTWNSDNNWLLVTELPRGRTYQYKAVVVDYNNNALCYCWQLGNNREFQIDDTFNGSYFLNIVWNESAGNDVDACSVGDPCQKQTFITTVV